MSKKNEKSEKRVRDMYRLSIETVKNLSQALSTATKEIQRDQDTGEVVTGSALYCDLLPLQVSIGNSWIWREKHNDNYINEQAVRNILGSLDLIGDMNNKKK